MLSSPFLSLSLSLLFSFFFILYYHFSSYASLSPLFSLIKHVLQIFCSPCSSINIGFCKYPSVIIERVGKYFLIHIGRKKEKEEKRLWTWKGRFCCLFTNIRPAQSRTKLIIYKVNFFLRLMYIHSFYMDRKQQLSC